MQYHIIGAGLTGCVIARRLKDAGHSVILYEKNKLGGLCRSEEFGGTIYEPHGPHLFHTDSDEVYNWMLRFCDLNDYRHTIKALIPGHPDLFDFPPSRATAKALQCEHEISGVFDRRNFETTAISLYGKTIYEKFIYHYTKKMWGKEPRELSASLAKRLAFRDNWPTYFADRYQGNPVGGYTKFFQRMIEGIPIIYTFNAFEHIRDGQIIYTGPIDALLDYKYGRLAYRTVHDVLSVVKATDDDVPQLNFCDDRHALRMVNYRTIWGGKTNIISIEYSHANGEQMYPMPTESDELHFLQYLEAVVNTEIIPAGRLGLYKYLNMDSAILLAFEIAALAPAWKGADVDTRLELLREKRGV